MVLRHGLALLILIIFQPVQAGEIQYSQAQIQDGVYSVHFDVIIHAQFDKILASGTDHQSMDRHSESPIGPALMHSSC